MVTQKNIFGEQELSPTYSLDDPRTEVYVGDCRDVLAQLPEESVDLIFADPPFNWNVPYADWKDNMKRGDYLEFTYDWLDACIRVLAPRGSLWVNIPDDSAAEVVLYLKGRKLQMINWCIWHFRFGQCRDTNFIVSKVHVLYFVRDRKRRIWNPEEILEPSDRATTYADARTRKTRRPGMRLPLDVWYGRFWGRVQGNSKERRENHQNQIPETYMERVILACTDEGDLVLDPFLGSGTTCVVARSLNRQSIGIEYSSSTAESSVERIKKGAIRIQTREQRRIELAVQEAYYEVHAGSADDLIIREDLNAAFIEACRRRIPNAEAEDLNWALLKVRKSGKLGRVAEKSPRIKYDAYIEEAACSAAKQMKAKYKKDLDRIFCNPQLRAEFDELARANAPDVEPYLLRKAALKWRKRRKSDS